MTVYKDPSAVALSPKEFCRIAKALSDPRRVAMLEAISSGEQCANQMLCRDFPVSKATVSHHLKELVQAGLVESERDGQYVIYRSRPETLRAYTDELLRRLGGPGGGPGGMSQ
jgi:ArsR family transcriptional regulator